MTRAGQRASCAALALAVAVALSSSGCTALAHATGAGEAARGPSLVPSGRDYYPQLARELGLTGRVGVECSVDGRGEAQDLVIVESGGLVLDDAARKVFSDQRFLIPPDWSTRGGPANRYRYGVIFQLRGKPAVAPFEDKRLTVVIVSGSGS